MFGRSLVACCALVLPCAAFQVQAPRIAGEIFDGAPLDVAAGPNRIWVAQGRGVAVLDAQTGTRLGDDPQSPYDSTVQAIEYEPTALTRAVVTMRTVHVFVGPNTHYAWQPPATELFPGFQDVKLWTPGSLAIGIAGNQVHVFDYGSGQLVRIGQATCPIVDVSVFRRVHVREVDGHLMAYLVAGLRSQTLPRPLSVVIADLDLANFCAQPAFYTNDWRPHLHYNDPYAATRAVEVFPNLVGTQDIAFVADVTGQLTKLDVSDPANPVFLAQITPNGTCGPTAYVYNLLSDPGRGRLYVAGEDKLYTYEVPSMTMTGCTFVHFSDAGKHDMALVKKRDGTRRIWTATNKAVSYVLNAIDVRTPQPVHVNETWWISSSDGAVAAPRWNSVYLPTFGGLARWDMTDETQPAVDQASYRPANQATEHIEILYPDRQDPTHALLVTATGLGGAQLWAVSQNAPNPAAPTLVRQPVAAWGPNAPVYQNDAEPYQRGGKNYVLGDLANLATGAIALQSYELGSGQYAELVVSSPFLAPNSMDVCTTQNLAIVSCRGGFFVANLTGLPASLSLAAVQQVDVDGDGIGESLGGIAANAAGTALFVATDSHASVLSYALDPVTGQVTGPLCTYTTPQLTGSVGRARFFAATGRLYVPARGGTLFEFDASNPQLLTLLSTWRSSGCTSELQDAHIYDFGLGPRVLAVKNTEGFVLLDPEDGL